MAGDDFYSSLGFEDLDEQTKQALANVLAPSGSAAPPSTPPQTRPAQSTPQTGSLATAPSQASPRVGGPPMISGSAAKPEDLANQYAKLQPSKPSSALVPTGLADTIAQSGRYGGSRAVIHDLNGDIVPKNELPANRSALGPALAARQGFSTTGRPQSLNLGPSTLQPQLDAQTQAFGRLMQMKAKYPGPTSPGPAPASLGSPEPQTPSVPAYASNVASPGQEKLAQDEAQLARYQQTGPGVDQIKSRWGRVLGKTLDIAGSVIAPGAMQWIPGTTLHNQMLQGLEQGRIANDEGQLQSAAQLQDTQSQTNQRNQRAALEATNAQVNAARPITQQEAKVMGEPELEGQSWTPKSITAYMQAQARNKARITAMQDQVAARAAAAGMDATFDENGLPTFTPNPNSPKTMGATQAQRAKDADAYGLKGDEKTYYILTGRMRDPLQPINIKTPSADESEYQDWKRTLGHPPTAAEITAYRSRGGNSAASVDRDINALTTLRKSYAEQIDNPGTDPADLPALKQRLKDVDGRIATAFAAQSGSPTQQPQPNANPQTFTTKGGKQVSLGDHVRDRKGRQGIVTGFNTRTGKAKVDWGSGQ